MVRAPAELRASVNAELERALGGYAADDDATAAPGGPGTTQRLA